MSKFFIFPSFSVWRTYSVWTTFRDVTAAFAPILNLSSLIGSFRPCAYGQARCILCRTAACDVSKRCPPDTVKFPNKLEIQKCYSKFSYLLKGYVHHVVVEFSSHLINLLASLVQLRRQPLNNVIFLLFFRCFRGN